MIGQQVKTKKTENIRFSTRLGEVSMALGSMAGVRWRLCAVGKWKTVSTGWMAVCYSCLLILISCLLLSGFTNFFCLFLFLFVIVYVSKTKGGNHLHPFH